MDGKIVEKPFWNTKVGMILAYKIARTGVDNKEAYR
jgi:hypothetical protein